ncbi:MAG: DNA alkylation repair protein [Bacillaceae bacterium]|nr:DNA alkylation repair protein [Bacillaceae bacterium]
MNQDYYTKLTTTLRRHSNLENKLPMEKYMKNHFPFLGIKSPELKALVKTFFQAEGKPDMHLLRDIVLSLWSEPEREFQYVALQILVANKKQLTIDDIPLLEKMVIEKSWWDTVDLIASNLIGYLLMDNEEAFEAFTEKWINSDNMWLNRTAILYQLKYKEKTDVTRLFRYIGLMRHSKEFFIQKAIGWALREYSKTDPTIIETYIQETVLAPLSVREGLKIIRKK